MGDEFVDRHGMALSLNELEGDGAETYTFTIPRGVGADL